MNRTFLAVTLIALVCGIATAAPMADDELKIEARLMEIAVGPHRSDAHIARNSARHPVETLMFFGIRPDMTVVEISPGGSGWYTEILAPFLRDSGMLYAGGFDPQSERDYYRRNVARYAEKLSASPEHYDQVRVTVFAPPAQTAAAPAGSADMVVTFRNTHGWLRNDTAEGAYRAFYRMLKPGGVLGVVQHRATPGIEFDPAKGYVSEAEIVRLAGEAGFRLDGVSDINANPADTADHPEGVWTLPPSLRLGEVDRDKYLAIGESDRMTLRFVKD